MKVCWNCNATVEEPGGRHKAPCGAICGSGCSLNVPKDEPLHLPPGSTHDSPWEGPPETDGHYHGECPNGCFKDCCKPKGNLCGPKCQQCFPKDVGEPGDALFACCLAHANGAEHDENCRHLRDATAAILTMLPKMSSEARAALLDRLFDEYCKICGNPEPCYCAPCYDE